MAELTKAIARLMEERAQAPTEATQHRQLLERLRARLTPGERAAADAFARLLLQRASPEWIDRISDEMLVGLCTSAFQFFAAAGPEPRVRVFNPEFERDGWDAPVTVIETVLGDRPFIVDTVRNALHRAGCPIRLFLHPVIGCERDAHQAVVSIGAPETTFRHESFTHTQVERIADPAAIAALETDLKERLGDVLLATNDYQAMRRAAETLAGSLRSRALSQPLEPPLEEIAAFLDWLREGNFVFLGYRQYRLIGEGVARSILVDAGSGLGLLRKTTSSFAAPRPLVDLPAPVRHRIEHGPPLIITKTNAESPVHRRARMDYIGVRDYDAEGRVCGERRLIGLFTSRAYAEESAEVPLLRRKLQRILEAEETIPESHDYKAFVSFFNSMPKEYLFAASVDELREDIQAILAAEGTDDVRVIIRPDQLERGLFVLVILPRERFSADLRRGVQAAAVRAYSATVLHEHVAMDESDQVRMHYYLAAAPELARHARAEDLQREVRDLLRTWDDRLRDAIEREAGAAEARSLAKRYARIFSPEYKAATDVRQAAKDIGSIEALASSGKPQIDIAHLPGSSLATIRLYLLAPDLILSDFLPVLENLGLRVYAADPLNVAMPDGITVHLECFKVEDCRGERLDLDSVGPLLGSAILAHFGDRLANDELNTLVTAGPLAWEQVNLLRTYANHTAQSGLATQAACLRAMAQHPETAQLLWRYFRAKLDPRLSDPPRDRLVETLPDLERQVLASLDAVETVIDDSILRAVFAEMAATTRTNFFNGREDGAVAIKLEPRRIPHSPRPQPLHEIFVYARHVEGVHLRAGMVARGGIRLTDRPDDYRTEVLGLMKTQTAKNAIIIPTGAKGGFLVRAGATRPPAMTDVVRAYRTFISSLLDLTDNIVQGRVVAAKGVLYDEPDPYLVVAADKGTATFSDIANEIAEAHHFWLGDAFASGGSQGYDHKRIGITARGAWECVRRHFRELGVDADKDPITVIGIGDMSGDVFGNAMLLSRNLHLRAGFNHRHIFLDPQPDPERAFEERQRLFQLERSGWDDYDPKCISTGGGVHLRGAKKIPLTSEVQEMLGIDADALSGEELIRAVLSMPADLLWNGGIGTYVKASFETDADVGDSANDAVRIDATDLHVRVVGEGGNLGFTQQGRIEYATHGGRINTDAIDNAGGVSLSDHEVNLKIALRNLVEASEITAADRNRLLVELAEDVTAHVLEQNARQAFAITLDQVRSQTALKDFVDLMQHLDTTGVLDRGLAQLPDREALRRRRPIFLGLSRPELAVLLAHSKLGLQHELLESSLPDDPFLERALFDYFPRPVIERYRQSVRNHRLRREIIAVEVANGLIDMAGSAFVNRVQEETGCQVLDVVRSWTIVAAITNAVPLYLHLVRNAASLARELETEAAFLIEHSLERACKWLIETQNPAEGIGDVVQRYLGSVYELSAQLPSLLPPPGAERLAEDIERFTEHGLDADMAAQLGKLRHVAELLEIAYLSTDLDVPLGLTADTYYRISSVIDVGWIRDNLAACVDEGRWERRAVEGLSEGLVYARRVMTRDILLCREGGGDIDHCVAEYERAHARQIEKIRTLLDDIKSATRPNLAALVVVMREIGRLCGRG